MSDFYDDDEEKSQDLSSLSTGNDSPEDSFFGDAGEETFSSAETSNEDEKRNLALELKQEYSEETEQTTESEEEAEEEPEPDYDDYSDDLSESEDDEESEDDGRDEDYDIEHPDEAQNRDILDAEEDELSDPLKNDAFFLDRNKIILIITIIAFVVLILFLCMPQKRKQKKNEELDKAGQVYIPSEIDRWTVENENTNSAGTPEEEINSSRRRYTDEELSIPGIDESKEQHKAPVEVPQKLSQGSGNGNNNFPVTNRNEQQKAFFNIPLEKSTGGGLLQNATTAASRYTGIQNGGSYTLNPQTGAATYTPASLNSNVAAYLASQGASSYDRQNNQSGKQQFLDKERGKTGTYQWNSDFSLWKGTVIPAVLDTGINTDLPGVVIATVTENVYSSNNGNYILIPQGSKLFAEYNSSISYGQNRIQVVWNTLIRPDGLEINLGSMNGVDQFGFSGYKGSVNNHPFEYAKAIGMIAMFSVLDTKMENTIDTQKNQYAQNAMSDAYATSKRITEKIIDRALDIQPTITIDAGTEINLITNLTMELPPLDPYPVEEKYVREY